MQIRSRYTPRETALLRISDMCIRYFFPKRLYLGRLVCVECLWALQGQSLSCKGFFPILGT